MGTITISIITIVVSILVFFAIRGILLWYWKINKIEALLQLNNDLAAFSIDKEKTIIIKHKDIARKDKITIGKYLQLKNKSDYTIIEY